jgi:gluconolactonase
VIAVAPATGRLPGPPELLPGRPDAVVDLQTADGVELVRGQWRYSDCRVEEVDFVELGSPDDPLGPGTVPNRTYDVAPHAEGVDYDDSHWRILAPDETTRRLANGLVCFNWYRITVTIPELVGGFDPTGAAVVFEVVADDYAEVWVNGELPITLGDSGGPVAAGFNAPNRVLLTRDARPGDRYVIAVFGINGPISASPRNYIWLRNASLDLYAAERACVGEDTPFELEGEFPAAGPPERLAHGFDGVEALLPLPDGSVLVSVGHTIYRWRDGRVTVVRPKADAAALALSPTGMLTIAQAEHRRAIRVNPHGDTSVVADGLEVPQALAYGPDGSLFVADRAGVRRDGVEVSGGRVCALARAPGGVHAVEVDGRILTLDSTGVDVLCELENDPCGLAVDDAGLLYAADAEGVSLHERHGERRGALRLSAPPRALGFGGSELYVASESSLYRVPLTTRGAS